MSQIKKLKYSKHEFIDISKKIYGDIFNYDNVDLPYLNKKLNITCKKHGDFKVYGFHHIKGKGGCIKCNSEKNLLKILYNTRETRIYKFKKFINENNIPYIFNKTFYIEGRKIKLYCNVHGWKTMKDETFYKNKGCNQCKKIKILTSKQENYILYKSKVRKITEYYWKNKQKYFNPENLTRGKKLYHIDHEFSIKDGFENNIPPYIIGHWTNLQMLHYKDNIKKQDFSNIDMNFLINRYFKFTRI